MAEASDKPNIWQPFTDIVGGQRDEGYVNLANDMRKKIDLPKDANNGSLLAFNSSLNAWVPKSINSMVSAVATGDLTITTTQQTVPGTSITLDIGTWLVTGISEINITVGSTCAFFTSILPVGGTASYLQQGVGVQTAAFTGNLQQICVSVVVYTAAGTASLTATKTPNVGTLAVKFGNSGTGITAVKLS